MAVSIPAARPHPPRVHRGWSYHFSSHLGVTGEPGPRRLPLGWLAWRRHTRGHQRDRPLLRGARVRDAVAVVLHGSRAGHGGRAVLEPRARMNRPPKPETKRALLVCESTGLPAWHHYVGTYEHVAPSRLVGPGQAPIGGPAWAHVFESDAPPYSQRVYGIEERIVSPIGVAIPAKPPAGQEAFK